MAGEESEPNFSLTSSFFPPPQPFRRSLAQVPQLEKYAPARCPAAPTAACALVRSGARARSADGSKRAVALEGVFSGELKSKWEGEGRPEVPRVAELALTGVWGADWGVFAL